jgi:hypothetical protein
MRLGWQRANNAPDTTPQKSLDYTDLQKVSEIYRLINILIKVVNKMQAEVLIRPQ